MRHQASLESGHDYVRSPVASVNARSEELIFRAEAPFLAEAALRAALATVLREGSEGVEPSAATFVAAALRAARGCDLYETFSPAARGRLLRGIASCAQAFAESPLAARLFAANAASQIRHAGAPEISAVVRDCDGGLHVVAITRLHPGDALERQARALGASLRLPRAYRDARVTVHLHSLADRRRRSFTIRRTEALVARAV